MAFAAVLVKTFRCVTRAAAFTTTFQPLARNTRLFASLEFPERSAAFARLNDKDVEHFKDILGDVGVVTDSVALEGHNRDWMRKYEGKSSLVLRPASTDQVCAILEYCNSRRIAVVPQGGNTGLVGGSVPVHDEVILHTGRMNNIINFDKASGVVVAQSGCVLGAVDAHVWPHGWIMPLDLGAKGSCHIGGNVSTNAGGLRLLRYGSLHGSVLGVEVALADGRKLDLLKTLRKDNTGYDLKQLFIGAEGTLGIVTAVAIQCAPRPASVNVVFFALPSYDSVLQLLSLARRQLGEILSAFEFIDALCMRMVCQHLPGVTNPLGPSLQQSGTGEPPFYALVETHGSNQEHDAAKLQTFLESAMSEGIVLDGVVAESESQAAAIWRCREGVAESLSRRGAVYKYDVSLPVQGMYQLVEEVKQRLAGLQLDPQQLSQHSTAQGTETGPPQPKKIDAQHSTSDGGAGIEPGGAAATATGEEILVVGYGHVGDGNLHLNVSVPRYTPQLQAAIEPFVYERTAAQGGSISAEHGLGVMKADVIGYSKPPEAVQIMKQLKQVFDPNGILNPYKVLPT